MKIIQEPYGTSFKNTQTSPWKTIGHAVGVASGNDTIYIYPGDYIESIDLTPTPKRELLLIGLGEDDSLPVIESTAPDKHTVDFLRSVEPCKDLQLQVQQMPME